MRLGTVLGILGGGQLGRMSALAAARLGIKVHIFTPEEDSPASQVSWKTTVASYEDKRALRTFAEGVDVISYEFENIPVETIRFLQALKPVLPDDRLLEIAQDRIREKSFLQDIGIPVTRWSEIRKAGDISETLDRWGADSAILKTARFGYDGKGQAKVERKDDFSTILKSLAGDSFILEEIVDFSCEISVVVARDRLGQTAVYPPVLNEHKNHILARTTAPAPIPPRVTDSAKEKAILLADAVDLVGVLCLELFVTRGGELLANEIAPRTHNSGHWTIDACACSQFDQHVRTVCSLPVGDPGQHSDALMVNLIGDDIERLAVYLEEKNACLHLYGKTEARPGRKMGHVTILKPKGLEGD